MIVMIVEGSEIILERLVVLTTEGNNVDIVHKASSFHEATKLLDTIKPGIAILDMCLPQQKSVELFKIIRHANRDTSFIILFNFIDAVTCAQYEWLDADFVFDKYNDFDKIPAAINTIISKKT